MLDHVKGHGISVLETHPPVTYIALGSQAESSFIRFDITRPTIVVTNSEQTDFYDL
jgi:hypothetical protein